MTHQQSFHAPDGAGDFLGWRKRAGATEIVYDDGVARRMIWRVAAGRADDRQMNDALRAAVSSARIVPSLYDEMKKRAIAIERVTG